MSETPKEPWGTSGPYGSSPPPQGYGPPGPHGPQPPQGYGPYGPPGPQAPLRPDEERLWSVLSHASYFLLAVIPIPIAPIVIMLTLGTRSQYVRYQAVEALNFQITVLVATLVSSILMFVLIGFLLLPIVIVGSIVLAVIAAIRASNGIPYRYPLTMRLVK